MSKGEELEAELSRLKELQQTASREAAEAARHWQEVSSEVLRLSGELRNLGGLDE